MKKCIQLIIIFLLFGGATNTSLAKSSFFDSKSQIIGITGDYDALVKAGFKNKVFENPIFLSDIIIPEIDNKHKKKGFTEEQIQTISQQLVDKKVGKQILDYLFNATNGHPNETLLNERALKNSQTADIERANVSFLNTETVLKDDYLPILENNYIYFEKWNDKWRSFIIYRVNIDKDVLNKVYTYWNEPDLYNQIQVGIELLSSGAVKESSGDYGINGVEDIDVNFVNKISKEFNQIAIRGQLVNRNPATAVFPSKGAVNVCDRVSIYRQSMNDNGTMVSKRVSRALVCDTIDNRCNLIFVDRIKGSYKDGDWVVKEPYHNMGLGFYLNFYPGEKKCYGLSGMIDWRMKLYKSGISLHLLGRLRLDTNSKEFDELKDASKEENEREREKHSSFFAFNGGMGLGVSYNLLGWFEVMPYFIALTDIVYVNDVSKINLDEYGNETESKSQMGLALGVTGGVRCDINIWYPVKLSLGVEYSPFWGLNLGKQKKYEGDNQLIGDLVNGINWRNYKDLVNEYGLNRTGFAVYAGIKWVF